MAHQSKYPSLDRQWHKMMFSFFEYLPMQYRQATEREWQIRKMIWSFKDGKAYLNIAWMIANKLHQVFGDDVKNIVFACVPASSADKNELRYKGFASDGKPVRTFEVAGDDGLFYPAQAVVENGKIKVWSDKVKEPETVRYGWQPFTRANLVNGAGLPASTFRAE